MGAGLCCASADGTRARPDSPSAAARRRGSTGAASDGTWPSSGVRGQLARAGPLGPLCTAAHGMWVSVEEGVGAVLDGETRGRIAPSPPHLSKQRLEPQYRWQQPQVMFGQNSTMVVTLRHHIGESLQYIVIRTAQPRAQIVHHCPMMSKAWRPGHCLLTPEGGGGAGQPRPTPPHPHQKTFPRERNFIKGAGTLRPI